MKHALVFKAKHQMENLVSSQFAHQAKWISTQEIVETVSHIQDRMLVELFVDLMHVSLGKLSRLMESVQIAQRLQELNWANRLVEQISVTSVRYYKKTEHANYVNFTLHQQVREPNVKGQYVNNDNISLLMESVDTVEVLRNQLLIYLVVNLIQN